MAPWRLPAAASLVVAALLPLIILAGGTGTPTSPEAGIADQNAQPERRVQSARIPLAFEPNARRGDPRVRYVARSPGVTLGLTDRDAVLSLAGARTTLRSRLIGASASKPRAEARLPGIVNWYRGDRSRWRSGIPTFGRVRYASVYPGIDLVYHGTQGRLEYDFELAPGTSPARIGVTLSGARRTALAGNGDLLIHVRGGTVRQQRPVAYQRFAGKRVPVSASYRLSDNRISFRLGRYDHTRPLVIDPTLSYASYLGGTGDDQGTELGRGSDGSLYIVGYTTSNDFPGATARTNSRTDKDAFITKFSSSGTSRLYSTYLGGTGDEIPMDVAADSSGRAYVIGQTFSSNYPEEFPTAGDLLSCSHSSGTGFLARLSASGGINYSTCFGSGSTRPKTVVLRETVGGVHAYIAGATDDATNMPISGGAFQGTKNINTDGFFADILFGNTTSCPLNAGECELLQYGTYLGGDGVDDGSGVAVDSTGKAYVAIAATSQTLLGQTTTACACDRRAVITKLDPTQSGPSSLVWATIYSTAVSGGNSTQVWPYDVAVTSTGAVYFAGYTDGQRLPSIDTSSNLPTGANSNGVIGHLQASNGAAVRTLLIGGTGFTEFMDMTLQENAGQVALYLAGHEANGSLNQINAGPGQACPTSGSGQDRALVAKVTDTSTPYGIYLACVGGAAHEIARGVVAAPTGTAGDAWIAGYSEAGFGTTADAQQGTFGGAPNDAFLAHVTAPSQPAIDSGPSVLIGTSSATFTFSDGDSGINHFECSDQVAGALHATPRSAGSCTGNGTTSYSGLADGQHVFGVSAVDSSGGDSGAATRSFTVDTTAPAAFDLVSPDDGATTGSQPTLTWNTTTDLTAVSYAVFVDEQKVADVAGSSCGSTCSVDPSVASGPHNWRVVATDEVGHQRTSNTTRGFTWFDPPTADFTIAPNPVLAGRSTTFDASISKPASRPIEHYEWDLDGDGRFETDSGGSPKTTRTYSLAATVKVRVRASDGVGQSGTAEHDLRVSDAPGSGGTVGVSINDGAQYTNKPAVTLTIVAPAGVTSILLANDGGFAGAIPQPLAKGVAWKLDSSGPERLPKTVYLRFLTGPFASPNYTDDIILDERPPVVDSASIAGAATAASSATVAKVKSWKVKVKAHDTNSGVGFVQVTTNKRKPGKLLKYARTVKAKSATPPKFLRARDRAGNFSSWKKLR